MTDAANSKMRRRKLRKDSSLKYVFFKNSKKKDYYNNSNGAEIILSSHFEHEYDLGHKISLLCIAKGDPLPRMSWFKDGNEIVVHPHVHVVELKFNDTQVKSKLEIDPARQMDAGNYECQANNKYSIDRRTFKADF